MSEIALVPSQAEVVVVPITGIVGIVLRLLFLDRCGQRLDDLVEVLDGFGKKSSIGPYSVPRGGLGDSPLQRISVSTLEGWRCTDFEGGRKAATFRVLCEF